MIQRGLFLCCVTCLSVSLKSETQNFLSNDSLESEIFQKYESLLVEKVSNDLLNNSANYLEFPNTYWDFLNETFLVNWDFDATTKALIGSKIFDSLSNVQFFCDQFLGQFFLCSL